MANLQVFYKIKANTQQYNGSTNWIYNHIHTTAFQPAPKKHAIIKIKEGKLIQPRQNA